MSRRLTRGERRANALLSALLACSICVQGNRLAGEHLRLRRDFSADQLYGLAGATRGMLAGLEDVLVVEAYLTGKAEHAAAQVARGRLLDLLRELRTAAGERLVVRVFDPNSDSAARLEAERRGISPVGVLGVQGTATVRQDLYLGFVLRHRGREETLSFVLPQHFEARFTAALRKLTRERPRVVGFLSGPGFSIARDTIALQHRVVEVGRLAEGEAVPEEVEVLVVARPDGLHPRAAFALDQFVQRGGKLLLLLERVHTDYRTLSATAIDSGLDAVLATYGLSLGRGHVFELTEGARDAVELVDARGSRREVEHPYHLLVTPERLARDHPATSAQPALRLHFAHPVEAGEPPPGAVATVLAASTARACEVPAATSLAVDLEALNAQAAELLAAGDARPQALAIALEGRLPSAFAGGAPAPLDAGLAALRAEQRRQALERGEEPPPAAPETTDEPVHSAERDARVVVVGDADWAADELLSILSLAASAEQRMFLANLVDWLALEPELMALRSRIPRDRRITDFLREEREERGLVNLAGMDPAQVRDPERETEAARAAARRRWLHMGAALLGSALLLLAVSAAGRWLNRVGVVE